MEQFGARDFFSIVQALSNLQAVFREDQNTLKGSDLHRGVEDWLISMERDCRKVGLGVSTKLISLPKVLSGERVP